MAENFHTEQNRQLLGGLSEQTGGNYYRPSEVSKIKDDIRFSEAGITVREIQDLWNMPALFLLLVALRGGEWRLRKKWGGL